MGITAVVLATSDRYGSMALFFVIALVITTPFAIRSLRRNFIQRAERRDPEAKGLSRRRGHSGDADAATPADPADLAWVIAAIDTAALTLRGSSDSDAVVEIVAPLAATLRGRPAPDEVTRALIDDALRRSGIEPVDEIVEGGERRITCRARSNPLPKAAPSDTI